MTDRAAIALELEGARSTFRALVEGASPEDLARPSNGTRWTNRQLLFHMLFGYRVVRALVPLVKVVSRLPPSIGRGLRRSSQCRNPPFQLHQLLGLSLGFAPLLQPKHDSDVRCRNQSPPASTRSGTRGELRSLDGLSGALGPLLQGHHDAGECVLLPTQHFDFHRRQLTLGSS